MMLSGSVLGLVLTGDIFNMFVMIEIMTFAAVALTAFRNNKFGSLEAAFQYLVIGSADVAQPVIDSYYNLDWSETFTRDDNLRLTTVLDTGHEERAWVIGVYNAVQLFFRDASELP